MGIVAVAATLANAAEPSLPKISVAQLLTDVQQASSQPLGPLTATVQETANLGLPALPQIGGITGQAGALTPLAGTTSLSIWYLNQTHVRVAEPQQNGESDLRLNGTTLWLWNSQNQTATHVLLPRPAAQSQSQSSQASQRVLSWSSQSSGTVSMQYAAFGSSGGQTSELYAYSATPSPESAARQVLAELGPSTTVRLGPNVTVAGHAAYQISLAPKASGSLIGQVLIAIDAARHVPLQVQVLTRSSSVAFQVGYTRLSFGPPAMSNFTFTPPPGAKVKTVTAPAGLRGGGLPGLGLPGLGLHGLALHGLGLRGLGLPFAGLGGDLSGPPTGSSSGRVKVPCPAQLTQGCGIDMAPGALPKSAATPRALPKSAAAQLRKLFIARLPKNMTAAQRAAAIRAFDAKLAAREAGKSGWLGPAGPPGKVALPRRGGGVTVLGKDWTTVIATKASPAVASAVQALLAQPGSGAAIGLAGPGAAVGLPPPPPSGSSSSSSEWITAAPYGSGGPQGPAAPTGPDIAVLRALLRASTPVHGAWGSGRLLRSALLTVLITSKGQILAGAVTPSVLYADVAALAR